MTTSIRVAIIEDEAAAVNRLKKELSKLTSFRFEILTELESIGASVYWLKANPEVDLLFMDIHLTDGLSFEVFRQVEVRTPILFTTAYDEYAIQAFEAQAIGYVLKPVRRERLAKALQQAGRLSRQTLAEVAEDTGKDGTRTQICVQHLGELRLIPIEKIAFFQADQKYTRLADGDREYLIDDSLKQLEAEFDDRFVRVHRNALVAVRFIDALEKSADGDVSVRLRGNIEPEREPLKVSRRHAAAVKRRLKGNVS